jgi:hypothetical protein
LRDQPELLQALEQRLSKAQYESLMHCQNVLRESRERRMNPGFYAASPVSVAVAAVPKSSDEPIAAAPSVASRSAIDWWTASNAKNVERAQAEGMTRTAAPDMWFCPICDKEVSEHHLEAHMDSNKHQRYKQWHDQKIANEERHARGELPDWMTVIDGEEHCKICNTPATEAHLHSQRHQKALAWHQSSGSTNQCRVGLCDSSRAIVPVAATPYPIPPNWGNPDHFEWRPDAERYFCKLCWKYADEAHIFSEKHTVREQCPEHYLGTETDCSYGLGAPPPPPKSQPPRPSSTSTAQPQAPPPLANPLALCLPDSDYSAVVSAEQSQETLPQQQKDDDRLPGGVCQWQRYDCDGKQEAFWWWCEEDGESFLEASPGDWCKYEDPWSGKSYWWLNDTKWFWVHSGSCSFLDGT